MANEPLDHKHHIITQSGSTSESIQMSPTDHEDHPLSIHDSSHQLQCTNMKDESVQTTIPEDMPVAMSAIIPKMPFSAEEPYQILLRYNVELIAALSENPLGIAETLLSKGFISDNTRAQMTLPQSTPQNKASTLVNAIRNKIKIAPKRYQEFLDILSDQAWTKDIVEALQSFTSSCTASKNILRSSDGYSTAPNESICNSKHSSSSEEYTIRTLNPGEEAELEAELVTSAERMKKKFAELLWDTVDSFKCQGIDQRSLITGVLAITEYEDPDIGKPLLDKDKKKLVEAQSIDTIFDILRPHMTFFNYEILETLIEKKGSIQDKQALSKYLREFRHFCRRSVFEVPKSMLGSSPDKGEEQQIFHVKVTKTLKIAFLAEDTEDCECSSTSNFNISLENAKHIQRKLAQVLKVKVSSLYLDSVSTGSTILGFLIPACVSLAGLDSDPEVAILAANGIHILCGPPGKPEPKELTSRGLVVQWSQPEYGRPSLAKYILYYQKKCSEAKPLSEWQKLELSSLETHTCVPDLRDGDTYVFKICAMSDAGTLQYSDESGPITLAVELTDPQQV